MVDVLEQSGARQPKTPLIGTPVSTISQGELSRPGVEAARALQDFGDKLQEAAVPYERRAGADAVGLDENGNPVVQLRPFAMGPGDKAFNEAAQQAFLSKSTLKDNEELQKIRQKNLNDPVGFKAESDAYIKSLGKGQPEFRGLLQGNAMQTQSQHTLDMSNKRLAYETANNKIAVTAQIDDAKNKLFALARQGGMETPEAIAAMNTISGLTTKLGENPAYGYPKEKIASDIAEIRSTALGETVVGEVDRAFTKGGRVEAQKILTDKILNNPNLSLDNQARTRLYNNGMARLGFLDGENKAQIAGQREMNKALIEQMGSGSMPQGTMLDDAITKSQSLGDAASVYQLRAARDTFRSTSEWRGLSPEQQVRQYGAPAAPAGNFAPPAGQSEGRVYQRLLAGGLSPVAAFGILGNLKMESGLNTAARNPGDGRDGSDSIGIAQWNSDRAANLKAFASKQGKDWRDLDTQADFVVHELKTSEGRAFSALSSAQTVEQAARAGIGYFRPAGFTWANPDGGHNSGARINAAKVLSGTLGTAEATSYGGAKHFSSADYAANPFLASAVIKQQMEDRTSIVTSSKSVGEAIMSGIDKGFMPNVETVAGIIQAARQFPEDLGQMSDKLMAKLGGIDDAQQALGQPSGTGQAMIDGAMARAQGTSVLQQEHAATMKSAYDKGVKALKDNQWQEAARRGWTQGVPNPLDFNSADALSAGIAARAGLATSIRAFTKDNQTAALSAPDVEQISSTWQFGNSDQKTAIIQAINQLPDNMLEPTLRVLGEKDATGQLAFVAGLSREAPQSALAVMRGDALLTANPKLAPKQEDWHSVIEKSAPMSLTAPELGKTRQSITSSIRSVYAGLSARDGDESGAINDKRAEEAVKIVTGGLVEHNGQKLMPPARGQSQQDFERLLLSLPDAEFKDTASKSGITVTAADVRRNFVLRGVGDGQYALQSKVSPAEWLYRNPVSGRDIDNTAGGYQGEQRFILNLKGREVPKTGGYGPYSGIGEPVGLLTPRAR